MTSEIRAPNPLELRAFYELETVDVQAYFRDGHALAIGGVERALDGRLVGYLDVKQALSPGEGLNVVRAMRKVLGSIEGQVIVLCHRSRYAQAERLLKALGFRGTDETRGGSEVWVWQSSHS